jgi:signal transduction histidine kinase
MSVWTGVRPLDAVLAGAATALSQYDIWVRRQVPGPQPLMSLVFVVATVSFLWRRRAPLLVVALAMAAETFQAVYSGRGAEDPGGWALFLVPLYAVGAYAPLGRAFVGGALASAAGFVHGMYDTSASAQADVWANAFFWLQSIAAWLIGVAVHRHRDATALALAVARAEATREADAAAAVATERARIARELHDIVSHTLSVMVVQADAGELLTDTDPQRARGAFGTIGRTGRQALDDMRRLLAILRADEHPGAELGPPPGLHDLPALAAAVSASGVDVHLTVHPADAALPEAQDLSVFRIVQEALTNTLKHAHARTASVHVTVNRDMVTVSVTDDGHGGGSYRPGGHGLVSIRERAAMFGGRVDIGASPDGGYHVQAQLPLAAPS